MELFKVIIDFSSGRYTDVDLNIKAGLIVEKMTGNPFFPTPTPLLGDITEANTEYYRLLNKVVNGTREDTARKNNARKVVETLLKDLGLYVQQISKGDEVMILSSGFDASKRPSAIGPLPQATGLTIKAGVNKGCVVANCDKIANASFYEFEYTEAPHAANNGWIKITSTKSRLLINELVSGKQYIFRVAGGGSHPSRNWSDEVSSFVL